MLIIALNQPVCEFSNSGPGDYWRPGPYYFKVDVTPAIIRGRPVLEARLLKEYLRYLLERGKQRQVRDRWGIEEGKKERDRYEKS